MLFTSLASTTCEVGTLQKSEIFSLTDLEIGKDDLHSIRSGSRPISLNFITLCCVGFVFNSSLASTKGKRVTWAINTFSRPFSKRICRIVSRNGKLSMSPTVPPTSDITASNRLGLFISYTRRLISSVICGIT